MFINLWCGRRTLSPN